MHKMPDTEWQLNQLRKNNKMRPLPTEQEFETAARISRWRKYSRVFNGEEELACADLGRYGLEGEMLEHYLALAQEPPAPRDSTGEEA
jgi:hypothetical protein